MARRRAAPSAGSSATPPTHEAASRRARSRASGSATSVALPRWTKLESGFPLHALSTLVTADRRHRDATYQAHRWFARRPPALLRALLLAATTDHTVDDATFWETYANDTPTLAGLTVLDPFMGGGTTLVEAGRLGSNVIGYDIDPVAVRLVGHELQPPSKAAVAEAADALLTHVRERCADLYSSSGNPLPLHTFSLAKVTCPNCNQTGELYRSLILARGARKPGSVARPEGTTVFCPDCWTLQHVHNHAKELHHCGRRFRLDQGTYAGYSWTCQQCGNRATHSDVRTGAQPRRVIAVEVTHDDGPRGFRLPEPHELAVDAVAEAYLRRHDLRLPSGKIPSDNKGGRPGSLGMETFPDLFSPRQLALFGTAFTWIDDNDLEPRVARALSLAVSNALATNNRLCGYATDYGRLAALFSVRGYSLPALAVELNALHPTAGRGTLVRTIDRVLGSLTPTTRRLHLPAASGATDEPGDAQPATTPAAGASRGSRSSRSAVVTEATVPHRLPPRAVVLLGSATDALARDLTTPAPGRGPVTSESGTGSTDTNGSSGSTGRVGGGTDVVDLVITDPPYFDYIAYDTLSAFYRAWSADDELRGSPVLPATADPVTHFATSLGEVLAAAVGRQRPDGLLALTYHSLNPEAWRALGLALIAADLRVTALWPVLADPHMGHHGTTGAIQYDLVIVARPVQATVSAQPPKPYAAAWLAWLGLGDLREADRTTCELAYAHLAPIWGRPKRIVDGPAAPGRHGAGLPVATLDTQT